jgi:hypothetical protein
MDLGTIGTIFGIVGVILSVVFAYLAFSRGKKKDDEGQGQQLGTIQSDLGYVKSGIDDIKAEQREQRDINVSLTSRVTAVEESTKQAHKRIDHLEANK